MAVGVQFVLRFKALSAGKVLLLLLLAGQFAVLLDFNAALFCSA
jgi:hypothetical protein